MTPEPTAPVAGGLSQPPALRHSPLHGCHQALDAKLVPFGGWLMPLAYPSGTLAEHHACREGAVVFDVSHLGTVTLHGPGSFDRLQTALSNDLRRVSPGHAQYTHLLEEADASVADDIIVWWVDKEHFHVMPNASNTTRVRTAVGGEDTTGERAVVAVQGPKARERLASFAPGAAAVGRFQVAEFSWQGRRCTAAGTGYTGEDGVECAVPSDLAPAFWQAVVDAGVLPAGLGARDTLRLEAGLPLHGHELGPGITPLQAGMGWVVGWDKPEFLGRRALLEERRLGPARQLHGLIAEGRQPPRQGDTVMIGAQKVGEVTSGNFSPVLGRGIALALLAASAKIPAGTQVVVDVRGKIVAATVASLPFVDRRPGREAGTATPTNVGDGH